MKRPALRYRGGTRRVRFLERPNRFLARVEDSRGARLEAHVPNPGRLRELLPPGGTFGYIAPASAFGRGRSQGAPAPRRTSWTLVSVAYPAHPATLVSVDTGAAAPLVQQALEFRALPGLAGWGPWRREVVWGAHRFDHGVVSGRSRGGRRPTPKALLEVKSSNLREGRSALFPDAPTIRGTGHALALARFARAGGRAALLFVVQRDDVSEVRPYGAMDPAFARAVQQAKRAGVRLLGRTLRVRPDGADWGRSIPVREPRWEPARDLDPQGGLSPGGRAGRSLPPGTSRRGRETA